MSARVLHLRPLPEGPALAPWSERGHERVRLDARPAFARRAEPRAIVSRSAPYLGTGCSTRSGRSDGWCWSAMSPGQPRRRADGTASSRVEAQRLADAALTVWGWNCP